MTPEEREAYMQSRREDNTLIGAHHTTDRISHVFVCQRCERAARFATNFQSEFDAHLKGHGVTADEIKAARRSNSIHTDADKWYGDTDYWQSGGAPLFIYACRRTR